MQSELAPGAGFGLKHETWGLIDTGLIHNLSEEGDSQWNENKLLAS